MTSPWIKRFDALLEPENLRKALFVSAEEQRGLDKMPSALAARKIEVALGRIFVPRDEVVALGLELLHSARAHCELLYPNMIEFQHAVMAEDRDLEEMLLAHPPLPVCISGIAGCGKSQFQRALVRALSCQDGEVFVDGSNGSFPMKAAWYVAVDLKATTKELLLRLAEEPEESAGRVEESVRRKAVVWGIALLIVDELQFLSVSSASALITRFLLVLYYLGLPAVYSANYSLLHKLVKRNSEEKQRLLSRCVVLEPPARGSAAAVDLLREYVKVMPTVLKIEPERDAEIIGYWSGDSLRLTRELTALAYQIARELNERHVTIGHFEAAYKSRRYAISRGDVEALSSIQAGVRVKNRLDLICPPELLAADARPRVTVDPRRVEAAMREAMTREERQAADRQGRKVRESNVVSIRGQKRRRLSSSELAANFSSIASGKKGPK